MACDAIVGKADGWRKGKASAKVRNSEFYASSEEEKEILN